MRQLHPRGFHVSLGLKVPTVLVPFSLAGVTGDLVLTSYVIRKLKPQILWGKKWNSLKSE